MRNPNIKGLSAKATTATHSNTQQHTATHSNTLHHTATHSNTQQHTATHSNTLQHTVYACVERERDVETLSNCYSHTNAPKLPSLLFRNTLKLLIACKRTEIAISLIEILSNIYSHIHALKSSFLSLKHS